MKKLIYIAGPYSADTIEQINANVRKAEEYGQEVLGLGLIPIIPHKISSLWDKWGIHTDKSHSWWLEEFCLPLLSRCDAALFIPGWMDSAGAMREHVFCERAEIHRHYSISDIRVFYGR